MEDAQKWSPAHRKKPENTQCQRLEASKFRGSLPVPNVQDLAEKTMNQVPSRYVINHGVSPLLIEDVKRKFDEFFKLPTEEKNKYKQQPGELQGFGRLFVVSDDQKLDWGWGDMICMVPLTYRIQLAQEAPSCIPVRPLIRRLIQIIGWIHLQDLRINDYPPCPQPERVMGLTNHSDSSAITILLQVNEIAGLQVKKDGKWILVEPLPNAFMVNIGDLLEVITNGTYRSIEHRVIVNSTEERLSVLSFHGMKLGGEVAPAPCLVTPESPPVFRTLSFVDYTERFFQQKLDGKSYEVFVKMSVRAPSLVSPESPPAFRTLSFADYADRFFQRKLDGKAYVDELRLRGEAMPSQ
ncbi:Codeine O-demethylase-like protein [Drosera capensis]